MAVFVIFGGALLHASSDLFCLFGHVFVENSFFVGLSLTNYQC